MEVGSDLFFCIVMYLSVKNYRKRKYVGLRCGSCTQNQRWMNVSFWYTTPEKSVVSPEDQVSLKSDYEVKENVKNKTHALMNCFQ